MSMRLPEQRLWDTMKRQRQSQGIKESQLFFFRVENRVHDGTPDTFWKPHDFSDCWIELKAPHAPKKASTRLLRYHCALSPEQVNWHIDYTRAGGRSYILARDSDKFLYMWPGRMAYELNKLSLADARASTIADNWKSIFQIVRGGWHEAAIDEPSSRSA